MKYLWLRWLCFVHGICYVHAEVKECDVYGPRYCQMCVSSDWELKKEHQHELRMRIINELRRRK